MPTTGPVRSSDWEFPPPPSTNRTSTTIGAAGLASAKIVKHATLKVYAGAPHGLADTHQTQFGGDLLEFVTLR